MHRTATLVVLVCLAFDCAWATSYIAVRSGNWHDNNPATSPWGGSNTPGVGDTVTIASPYFVSCEASTTCISGTNSGTNTAILVKSGASFTATSATLMLYGDYGFEKGSSSSLIATAVTFNPPAGQTYAIAYSLVGNGTPVLNLCGSPDCSVAGQTPTSITTAQTGGGGFFFKNPGGFPQMTWNGVRISACGSASQSCVDYGTNSNFNVKIQNTQFINTGTTTFSCGVGVNCTFDVVDWRGPLNTVAVAQFLGYTARSKEVRLITNATAYFAGSATSPLGFRILTRGMQMGKSVAAGDATDVPGFYGYNVNVQVNSSVSQDIILRNSFVVNDVESSGAGTCVLGYSNSNLVQQDILCYDHVPNPHEWTSGASAAAGPNLYQRLTCDGDGYYRLDQGDFVQDWGVYTFKNSLGINQCGTLITAGAATTQATVVNNTQYGDFGMSLCETGCNPNGAAPIVKNNLWVHPGNPTGQGGVDSDGVHTYSAFVRQVALDLDYNAFFAMPGSRDSGADSSIPRPPFLTNQALSGIPTYIRVPLGVVGGQSGKSATTVSGTALYCSGCNFTSVQPGDYVLNTALTPNGYATVAAIVDSSHLVLETPVSGFVNGNSFDVRYSYWADPTKRYGVDYGTHDIHVDPSFVDTSRSVASWLVANGGYGHATNFTSTNNFSLTAASGANITCSACTFQNWGITANDWVAVYAAATGGWRGTAQVQTVTDQTHLTLTSAIPNVAAGDAFTFVTNTRNVGRAIVALNGTAWDGSSVTFNPAFLATNAMNYLKQGFTAQNTALKGAGYDGSDIGAFNVGVNQGRKRRTPAYWRK